MVRRGLENRASELKYNHFSRYPSADTLVDTLQLSGRKVRVPLPGISCYRLSGSP